MKINKKVLLSDILTSILGGLTMGTIGVLDNLESPHKALVFFIMFAVMFLISIAFFLIGDSDRIFSKRP